MSLTDLLPHWTSRSAADPEHSRIRASPHVPDQPSHSPDVPKGWASQLMQESNAIRLLYVLCYASSASWIFQFNVHLEAVGLRGVHIGWVSSLIWLMMLVGQPWWGVWADRRGVVRCFRFALMASTVALVGFFLWGRTPVLAVVYTLVVALFYVPVLPLIDCIALDYIGRTGRLSYGTLRFWGAVGYGLGGPLAGRAMSSGETGSIFLVAAALSLIAIPIAWMLRHRARPAGALAISTQGLRDLVSKPAVQAFMAFMVVASISQSSIWFYLATYLREIGVSPALAGLAPTIEAYSELPFYFLAGLAFRRFGVLPMLLGTGLLAGIRTWAYSTTSDPLWVMLIEASNGITWTWFWLAAVEYTNLLVPPEWRATGQSLLCAAYQGAGAILGNWWCSWLYGESGSMRTVFAINGLVAIAISATALVIVLVHRRRSGPLPPSPAPSEPVQR